MKLVPIKVKIGLRPNKHADHPDWYKLPLAAEMEPATQMSSSWHYDKSCGHAESGSDSPIGMQWGLLFVTPRFAKEAKEVFPDLITELTEAEAEEFWNNRCTAHMSENKVDVNQLQGLQAELALRKELSQDVSNLKLKIAKALDPNDVEPGLRKNKQKTFVDAKQTLDIQIIASDSDWPYTISE